MALIDCPECGKQVSDAAAQCPNCAYPIAKPKPTKQQKSAEKPKKPSKKLGCFGTFFIIIIVLMVIGAISGNDDKKTPEKPIIKTAEQIRQEKLENSFSAWDGSHIALTKLIKQSMNDPKSYEHDKTVYWDKGDHLIVRTDFRGKNAFGGVVRNWVKAKVSIDGQVLEIIEEGP